MTTTLSTANIRRLRIRAQRLTPQRSTKGATGVAHVVRDVCGLQAQEFNAAVLSVRVRSSGLTSADVDKAVTKERSVVRIWAQRGTIHLLARDDLDWLLPLFGPALITGNKRRRAELGLDDAICEHASKLVCDLLVGKGPLTRAEISTGLAKHGIKLEGQAVPHLLFYCTYKGLICFGPDKARKPTHVLLTDWLDQWHMPDQAPDTAYTELVTRYLAAYGPAQPDDLAAWSGLPISQIRRAWTQLADKIIEVPTNDKPMWMLKSQADWLDDLAEQGPPLRLLPRFDTYLLGYRRRDLLVDPSYVKRINIGGGIIHPSIEIDGQIAGLWTTRKRKENLEVTIDPFEPLSADIQPQFDDEISDLGRFLGTGVTLTNPLAE